MRVRNLLPFIAVLLLIISCFLPWMTVVSKSMTITGVATEGTSFGKPAYFHFIWSALYLLFMALPQVWTKRVALGAAAFNLAWGVRNFMLLPACQLGDCPVRREGLYLLLLASIAMCAAILTYRQKRV